MTRRARLHLQGCAVTLHALERGGLFRVCWSGSCSGRHSSVVIGRHSLLYV